jgi:hypothetical protein
MKGCNNINKKNSVVYDAEKKQQVIEIVTAEHLNNKFRTYQTIFARPLPITSCGQEDLVMLG